MHDDRLDEAFAALKSDDFDAPEVRVLLADLKRPAMKLLREEFSVRLRPQLVGRPPAAQRKLLADCAERACDGAAADALMLVIRGEVGTVEEMRSQFEKSLRYAVLRETVLAGRES